MQRSLAAFESAGTHYDYAKLLTGNGAGLRLTGLSCTSEDAPSPCNDNPDCRNYNVQRHVTKLHTQWTLYYAYHVLTFFLFFNMRGKTSLWCQQTHHLRWRLNLKTICFTQKFFIFFIHNLFFIYNLFNI